MAAKRHMDIKRNITGHNITIADIAGYYRKRCVPDVREDYESLKRTNPEVKAVRFLQAATYNVAYMRVDKPELPFQDIRVRQAMNMAVDKATIMESYYNGNAELLSTPVAPYPEYMAAFTPLEEQSEAVQELYTYNPEKAKQLLAEAGYPDGFKTKMIHWNTMGDIDSVVASYWAASMKSLVQA